MRSNRQPTDLNLLQRCPDPAIVETWKCLPLSRMDTHFEQIPAKVVNSVPLEIQISFPNALVSSYYTNFKPNFPHVQVTNALLIC